MLKTVVKSSVRVLSCVALVALIAGTACVNSLMFHPEACKGGYGESAEGYVDIGTNGVKIAAIVLGPERGKGAILRCHGNAEDAANSLFALANEPKRFIPVDGADHNDLIFKMGPEHYLKKIEEFALEVLPANT